MNSQTLQPFGQHLLSTVWHAEHDGQRWHAGRLASREALPVTVAGGTVHYGLSVFEGLKAYRGANGRAHLFRPRDHARRLQQSALRLALPTVPEALFLEACAMLLAAVDDDLPPMGAGAIYLRPTLYASDEGLGLRPGRRHGFTVIANPCIDPPRKQLRLWAEPVMSRAAPGGLGGIKAAANYAAGLGGLLAARDRGYDDVLWLDALTHTALCEAGTMNVFAELDGVLTTPPLDGTLLAGITRDTVLTLAAQRGQATAEAPITLAALRAASAAGRLGAMFGTGTACRLVEIVEIGTDQGPIVPTAGDTVETLYQALKQAQEAGDEGWNWPVPASTVSSAAVEAASA